MASTPRHTSRERRSPRRRVRGWLWVVGAVLLVALVVGAFLAFQAVQVRNDLRSAENDARTLQAALTSGNTDAARAALGDLQSHSDSAYDTTHGFLWGAAAKAPQFGDDAEAVRSISGALRDISAEALPPLVDAAGGLNASSFSPEGGRIALEPLKKLAPAVAEARPVLEAQSTRVSRIDSAGLVGPLAGPVTDLQEKLADATRLLGTANTALKVLPSMLGGDGPREYLVMFQNNAEIRATGGLPGAFAVIHVEDGKISLGRQGSGADISFDKPVLPLTAEEKELFNVHLGVFFVDTNFTSDFPRTAELAREMWRRESGQQVDGVLSVDPVALSYLLEGTGPIKLADGSQLTAQNVVDKLLNQVYFDIENPEAQNAYFASAAKQIFEAVSAGQGDAKRMIEGLAEAAGEGRVFVHSFHPSEQDVLASTPVAGALPTRPSENPQVGVYLNDVTGAKMQYYLDYDVTVDSVSCTPEGVQTLEGTLTLVSSAPTDVESLPDYVANDSFGTEAGSQLLYLRIYAPTGGGVTAMGHDGKKMRFGEYTHEGRPVGRAVALVEPGQEIDVTFEMTSGPGQRRDVEVDVTPGIQRGSKDSRAASSCA